MPELPEVQTTTDGIRRYALGHSIIAIWTSYNSPFYHGKDTIKNPRYFTLFKKQVIGAKIVDAKRRGKNILVELSNGMTILAHMKMTGHFLYSDYTLSRGTWKATKPGPFQHPLNQFIRLVFTLSDGKYLVLSDMRKFAKITLFPTRETKIYPDLKKLGPEPLEKRFTYSDFKKRLSLKPNGKIKTVLMNQEIIAGIGNIYSDEILWRAGVHPETIVSVIPDKSLQAIFTAMKATLAKGIDFGGDSTSDYHNILGVKGSFQEQHRAYQKHKTTCSKTGCKGVLERKVIGGRSAHFCPAHQKLFLN